MSEPVFTNINNDDSDENYAVQFVVDLANANHEKFYTRTEKDDLLLWAFTETNGWKCHKVDVNIRNKPFLINKDIFVIETRENYTSNLTEHVVLQYNLTDLTSMPVAIFDDRVVAIAMSVDSTLLVAGTENSELLFLCKDGANYKLYDSIKLEGVPSFLSIDPTNQFVVVTVPSLESIFIYSLNNISDEPVTSRDCTITMTHPFPYDYSAKFNNLRISRFCPLWCENGNFLIIPTDRGMEMISPEEWEGWIFGGCTKLDHIALSPDGLYLAVTCNVEGVIYVFDMKTKWVVSRTDLPNKIASLVFDIIFSPIDCDVLILAIENSPLVVLSNACQPLIDKIPLSTSVPSLSSSDKSDEDNESLDEHEHASEKLEIADVQNQTIFLLREQVAEYEKQIGVLTTSLLHANGKLSVFGVLEMYANQKNFELHSSTSWTTIFNQDNNMAKPPPFGSMEVDGAAENSQFSTIEQSLTDNLGGQVHIAVTSEGIPMNMNNFHEQGSMDTQFMAVNAQNSMNMLNQHDPMEADVTFITEQPTSNNQVLDSEYPPVITISSSESIIPEPSKYLPDPSTTDISNFKLQKDHPNVEKYRRIENSIIVEPWWKPYKAHGTDGLPHIFFNGFQVPSCPKEYDRITGPHVFYPPKKPQNLPNGNGLTNGFKRSATDDKLFKSNMVYMEQKFSSSKKSSSHTAKQDSAIVLSSHAVGFGKLRCRVPSGKIHFYKGNIYFTMELKIPAGDRMKSLRSHDRFEDTVEEIQVKLSMKHVVNIVLPNPKESLGALALMIFPTDFGIARLKLYFRELNMPDFIWTDISFKALIFELPYNFFQEYERIVAFVNTCNAWAKVLSLKNNVCGFGSVQLFNDLLMDAGVCLKKVNNPTGHACYLFEVIPEDCLPTIERIYVCRAPPKRVVYVTLPSHRASFTPQDLSGLRGHGYLNDEIVDCFLHELVSRLPQDDSRQNRITYLVAYHFHLFLASNKEKNFDEISILNDMTKMIQDFKLRSTVPDDILEREFLLMPVCVSAHWYGIVVVNPGGAITGAGRTTLPTAIIILDSLKPYLNHKNTLWNIRAFLKLLFQKLQDDGKYPADWSFDYNLIKCLSPSGLPKQQNSYDCGVFMLQFFDLFITHLPPKDNPFNVRFSWNTKDCNLYRMDIYDHILTHCDFGLKSQTITPTLPSDDRFNSKKYTEGEVREKSFQTWGHLLKTA